MIVQAIVNRTAALTYQATFFMLSPLLAVDLLKCDHDNQYRRVMIEVTPNGGIYCPKIQITNG
jgi:hypothetical protein